MFHKATDLKFKKGTTLELRFQNGEVKEYDMARLFAKYPQLEALRNRDLFLSGKLMGAYGIIWNDDLDIEAETIYEEGMTVRHDVMPISLQAGNAVTEARFDSPNPIMFCCLVSYSRKYDFAFRADRRRLES